MPSTVIHIANSQKRAHSRLVSAVRVIECNVWGNGLAKGDHGDHADIVSVREYCLGTGLDYLRAIVCAKPSHGVTIMR